ncbi:MAG: cation:proton antiporter [Oscillospiraceae bacterium]
MNISILFYLAIMLFGGLLFGRLAKQVKLPNVTGYLIGGLIMGPSLLGLIPQTIIPQLNILSDVALGFIAFSIGTEFKASYFKRVGFTPIVIAIFEAMVAVIFVFGGLLAIGCEMPYALVLGAIAAATAPAATIMVIKQYKAKGPVTETLLSVVALDDAVALVAFGFAVAIAQNMTSATSTSLLQSIIAPLTEVVVSLVVGAIIGGVFAFLLRFTKTSGNRLTMAIAFVFITISISKMLNASDLLMCMAMGGVFVNISKSSTDIMNLVDDITPPIFMLFFVLSGAELDLAVVPTIGMVGIVYIVLRVLGKFVGAWFGAVIMKAPENVRKYLGPTLIPQAGVAIGLSLVAESVIPQHAAVIRAVVLCATLIYEIIGPAIVKITLKKAGEITQ